nr:MAG TPA: hypothetical protein [Bacteriophage sp.]
MWYDKHINILSELVALRVVHFGRLATLIFLSEIAEPNLIDSAPFN